MASTAHFRPHPEPRRHAAEQSDIELAGLANALGHPARVSILRLLARQKNCCSGALVLEPQIPPSALSEHLRALRAAGLIEEEGIGSRTQYCLNRERLARMSVLLHDLVAVGTRARR